MMRRTIVRRGSVAPEPANARWRTAGPAILWVLLLGVSPAFGKGSDIRFGGTVGKIDVTAGAGTVTIRVVGFDIPVKVNGNTDVTHDGDEVGLTALKVGDFVKISGFFSSGGIFAEEIQIADQRGGEFRLRGPITAVSQVTGGTRITLLGVNVLVDADTNIERRGPDGGFKATDLAVGMQVDTRGTFENAQLVASRVKVGNREDDAVTVDFEGKITAIDGSKVTVQTDGGGTAIVLITSDTKVSETLKVGQEVRVKGTLNAQLEVVADKVLLDVEKDDHGKGKEFEKEVKLTATAAGGSITGSVEISYDEKKNQVEQELEVEVEKGPASSQLKVRAEITGSGTIELGTMTTDSAGKGKLKLGSSALSTALPAGKDVRNIVKVQVTNATGTVLAEGTF